jgi:hypothetical protein
MFNWTLDYTGPRSPLIILEPSLIRRTSFQTHVECYAFPKGKTEGRAVKIGSPLAPHFLGGVSLLQPGNEHLAPDWFRWIEKDKPATGTTTLQVSKVREGLQGKYPNEFDPKSPPDLYLTFKHDPSERGELYSLDAWTGTVRGRMLFVDDAKHW